MTLAGLAIMRAVISRKALPMFNGSASGRPDFWRLSQSVTMRWDRSAISVMERLMTAGSGSLNPGVSGFSVVAINGRPFRGPSAPLHQRRVGGEHGAGPKSMSIGEMGGQTSHRQKRLQGGWRALRRCALLAVPALLAGCSFSPANWFHAREGGALRSRRAAAPGANQPYPNLASVPENPTPPDMAALEHISNGLIADRANPQHLAAAAPLTDPSLPSASPGLFGVGTATPPAPGAGQALPSGSSSTASASLAAATAPPAPPATTRQQQRGPRGRQWLRRPRLRRKRRRSVR